MFFADAESRDWDSYLADEPRYARVSATRSGSPARECMECYGYGFHYPHCDKTV